MSARITAETSPAYIWNSRKQEPTRFGEPCRLVAYLGHWCRVRVRFEDGHEVEVHRSAIRREREP